MQVTELNTIFGKTFSEANSSQPIIRESMTTEMGTNSKASMRKMRAESQSAQSRIERQIASDTHIPLNKENANRRLQYLDQMIAESFDEGEYSEAVILVCTYEKLALHIYLGNTAEAAACLSKIHELDEVQPDEDGFTEVETSHALLDWAAGNGTADVEKLGAFPDQLILLLLKAKGISLPEPHFSIDDYFIDNKEINEKLFARNYQEALTLLDQQLTDNKLSEVDRARSLQARSLCKAMLGDYEGALQDLNEVIDSGLGLNIHELPLIRGLIHFLNNNPEKARMDLFPSYQEEMTLHDYFWGKFQGEDLLSRFAMAKILGL